MPPTDSPCTRHALVATAVLALSSMLVPEESRATTSFAVIGAPESLTVRVQRGAAVSALRIPVDARWTAPAGESVRSYRLQKRVDGGP